MHFREWNALYIDLNVAERFSYRYTGQKLSIGLDNGLAPIMWQAIIWTNADLIHWHICGTRGD